jgi:predicted PurR-regulated permease PerM
MNQINPLHILGLLLVVILFLFFKLSSVQEEIIEADKNFNKSEKLALDVSALKNTYADQRRIEKNLQKIFSNRLLQSANLTVKKLKKSIKVSTQSIDKRALDYLMGKILNDSYNITSLKIKQLSREKASLEMEIK